MQNKSFELENPTDVDYGSLSPNLGILRVIYGGNEKKEIDLFNPKPSDIHIKDIANGLSNKSHFSGLTDKFFSIAEHSVLVYNLVRKELIETNQLGTEFSDKVLKYALLHDAAEAYIGDMISPMKLRFPKFKELEDIWENVIFERFNIDKNLKKFVKPFDVEALNIEYKHFYDGENNVNIYNLSPEKAKSLFIMFFNQNFNSNENFLTDAKLKKLV